jgi:single-strand DNA-binding protein
MSKDVNKFICIGRLTKDPTTKYTPQGTAVSNFSIAMNETFKGKDGQKQEKVEYLNVVLWSKLAEISSEYLKKGSKIYLEGRIQTRSYEKDGQTKYVTEVVGNDLVMLDGRSSGSGQPEAVGVGAGDDSSPF